MERYCTINNLKEVSELHAGMDFRKPEYRREVFLRFYGFHLKYKAFPGGVYYLIPHLTKGLSMNDKLWFCFLNGCTQNPCTTYVIFKQFPSLEKLDLKAFNEWHVNNWRKLHYDTDRRYQKGHLVEMVSNYIDLLAGRTQDSYFGGICSSNDFYENFDRLWQVVINNFFMFGRLSTFSYLEYLKIAGLFIECSSLFIDDKSGSKSHRNGLCKVLGRDDMDWHKSNSNFTSYTKQDYLALEQEGKNLLADAQQKFINEPFFNDISYFTLESCLCTYKSMYRENRRYPNVYNDMLYERILKAEKEWQGLVDFTVFWEARKEHLPLELRCEDHTTTVKGLCSAKQNWFRETGQLVMMDIDDKTFVNNLTKNKNGYSLNLW